MLYWQLLTEAAPAIQGRKDKAEAWARTHLSGFFANDRVDWDNEWERFERYLRAIVWLAEHRNRKHIGGGRKPRPERIPPLIDRVLAEVARLIQNRFTGETVHDLAIGPVFTNASGLTAEMHLTGGRKGEGATALRQVEDFTVFWQVVFTQFADPTFVKVTAGVCAGCGKVLPPTKSKRPRRAKHCNACNVKAWRQRHPEKARKMWRTTKASQRKEAREEMSCHSPRQGK
ncbi:MAG: hypothetical protein C0467_17620 [Planctomycetaceae bacterium]|nr:hypothetical protein [Planctomycetaceae bacterium]